jgi:hypothetical protein
MKKPYIQLAVLLLVAVHGQHVYGQQLAGADETRDRTTQVNMNSSAPQYEPQAVPEPPKDPAERALRAKIGCRFSRGARSLPLDQEPQPPGAPSPAPVRVDRVLTPPLPVAFSAVVAFGQVVSVQTFLSENKTAIYRESTFRVDEPLKSPGSTLKVGDLLTIINEGGSLILPNGQIVTYPVRGDGSPLVRGREYVLFLHENSDIARFRIVTAWELRAKQVLPTAVFCTPQEEDEVVALGSQQFLARVRSAVR